MSEKNIKPVGKELEDENLEAVTGGWESGRSFGAHEASSSSSYSPLTNEAILDLHTPCSSWTK